jgi:hypothetical protein
MRPGNGPGAKTVLAGARIRPVVGMIKISAELSRYVRRQRISLGSTPLIGQGARRSRCVESLNSCPAEKDGGASLDLMSSGVVGARSGSQAHVMPCRRLAVGSQVSGAGRGATDAYRCVVRAPLRSARTVRTWCAGRKSDRHGGRESSHSATPVTSHTDNFRLRPSLAKQDARIEAPSDPGLLARGLRTWAPPAPAARHATT